MKLSSLMSFIRAIGVAAIVFSVNPMAHAQVDIFGDESGSDGLGADSGLGSDELGGELGVDGTGEQPVNPGEADYQAGVELQKQGKWQEAVASFQIAIQKTGGRDPRPYLELGRSYNNLGSDREAQEVLTRAILNQYAGQVPGLIGEAYLERGKSYLNSSTQYADAVEDFGMAVASSPTNPDAHYFSGRAILLQVMTSPGQGNDQSGQASLQLALQSLTTAISLKADHGDAYLDRGRVLLRMRQIKFAVEDHEKAVEYLGSESKATADLAFSYRGRASMESASPAASTDKIVADYRKAIEQMDKFLAANPITDRTKPWDTPGPLDIQPGTVLITRAETYTELANELRQPQYYQNAISDCNTYLAVPDLTPSEKQSLFYTRGIAKRLSGDLHGAIDDLTDAIKHSKQTQNPYFPTAYLRRGIAHFRQGNFDLAISDFRDGSFNLSNPLQADPRAMFWMGLAQAKKGELESAIRSYTRAIDGYSEYGPAYVNRGLAYMRMGRFQRAYDDFSMAVHVDSDNTKAASYREMARQRLSYN